MTTLKLKCAAYDAIQWISEFMTQWSRTIVGIIGSMSWMRGRPALMAMKEGNWRLGSTWYMAQLQIFCQVPSLTPGSTICINLLMAEVNESGIQTMVAHSELLGHLQPLIFNDIRFMQGFPFLVDSTIEITWSLCGWVGTSFDQHIGQVLSQFPPPSNIEYIKRGTDPIQTCIHFFPC